MVHCTGWMIAHPIGLGVRAQYSSTVMPALHAMQLGVILRQHWLPLPLDKGRTDPRRGEGGGGATMPLPRPGAGTASATARAAAMKPVTIAMKPRKPGTPRRRAGQPHNPGAHATRLTKCCSILLLAKRQTRRVVATAKITPCALKSVQATTLGPQVAQQSHGSPA